MIFPTLHRNGTSKEGLTLPLIDVINHLHDAIRALETEAAPNARDYYVQDNTAFAAARREHEARLEKLADVRRELCAIVEYLEG